MIIATVAILLFPQHLLAEPTVLTGAGPRFFERSEQPGPAASRFFREGRSGGRCALCSSNIEAEKILSFFRCGVQRTAPSIPLPPLSAPPSRGPDFSSKKYPPFPPTAAHEPFFQVPPVANYRSEAPLNFGPSYANGVEDFPSFRDPFFPVRLKYSP